MRSLTHKPGTLALACATLALFVVALAVVAPAALGAGPITWAPAESTYGPSVTSFVAIGDPAPSGTGMTVPPTGVAYGSGFWTAGTEVFAFGFMNQIPTGPGMPSLAQTELAATALPAGTVLSLVFAKAAGQRVDSVAIIGDPDALVSLDYAPAASLTAAEKFTVRATVVDPVKSASGDVGAAFGLIIDCSSDPARDYYGSLFVANMHWLDVQPPTFTSSGMAGLSANGSNGTLATFDGIFAPAFLTVMGITDPTAVQGYVDVTAVTGWPGAAFAVKGLGDGTLWPSGYWKYRITNSGWSQHDIMYGRQAAKPVKAVGLSPKGAVKGARPTFKWRKVSGATTYEVRIFKGKRLLGKRPGCTTTSWRITKALPKGVNLTWKVKAVSGAGAGPWSAALRFKIR